MENRLKLRSTFPQEGPLGGNGATGTLKILALVFMFIDHSGKMLFPGALELRLLGRIAFPVYAWCLVAGFCRTRNVYRYALRLLAVGVLSQPLYNLALHHSWTDPNIFLTLLLGLVGLYGMGQRHIVWRVLFPGLGLVLASVLHADYGWRGVLLIYLLYGARRTAPGLAAVMVAFCLYWGGSSMTVSSLLGFRLPPMPFSFPPLTVQGFALMALPFLVCRFPRDWRLPSWAGYSLYPAHLAVLYLLEQLMGIQG